MSNLNMDGKALSKDIKSFAVTRDKIERKLHLLACSATAMAAVNGRTEWLNELHEAMSALHQDGMRSWLSPSAKVFTDKKWLQFSKDGGYKVIQGTAELRPTVEVIEAIAGDFNLSFVNYRAQKVARDLTQWEGGLLNKLATMIRELKGANEEIEKARMNGEQTSIPVPASIIAKLEMDKVSFEQDIAIAKLNAANAAPASA